MLPIDVPAAGTVVRWATTEITGRTAGTVSFRRLNDEGLVSFDPAGSVFDDDGHRMDRRPNQIIVHSTGGSRHDREFEEFTLRLD